MGKNKVLRVHCKTEHEMLAVRICGVTPPSAELCHQEDAETLSVAGSGGKKNMGET